jgi:hypothetical protein
VLDLGGDDDDFEEREGLEGIGTLGELLEEGGIAVWRAWGEWVAVGDPTMP